MEAESVVEDEVRKGTLALGSISEPRRHIISEDISLEAARKLMERTEKPGMQFLPHKDPSGRGQLVRNHDPDLAHECTHFNCGYLVKLWFGLAGVISCTGIERPLLRFPPSPCCQIQGQGKEPDQAIYVGRGLQQGVSQPTLVFEVAHSEPDAEVQLDVRRWVRPNGPSLMSIGIKITSPDQPGQPPEVMIYRAFRNHPALPPLQCGHGSDCMSMAQYDWQLWLPVDLLLHGASAFVRFRVKLALAVMAWGYSVLVGTCFAARDLALGRRSWRQVVASSLRSLSGPWWGSMPFDLYFIREEAYGSLGHTLP